MRVGQINFRTMKRLFIAVLAVAALTACSKEETVNIDRGEAIAFGNAFVDNATRAIDPSYGENGAALTEFQVWGSVNGGNGQSGESSCLNL